MTTDDVTNYFKIPYFFQDIMYVMSGTIFLFIFNILHKVNIKNLSNYGDLGDISKIIIFLSIAYFIGRITKIFGDFSIVIVRKILFIIFTPSRGIYSRCESEYQKFKLFIVTKTRTLTPNTENIDHDLKNFIHETEYLRKNYERNMYSKHFTSLLAGNMVGIFVLDPNYKLAILILFLTFYTIISSFKDNEEYVDLARRFISPKGRD